PTLVYPFLSGPAAHPLLHSFPTRRSSDLLHAFEAALFFNGEDKNQIALRLDPCFVQRADRGEQCFDVSRIVADSGRVHFAVFDRSEEHTSELQSPDHLVCRLLLEKKKTHT